jgi:hypothetical protein
VATAIIWQIYYYSLSNFFGKIICLINRQDALDALSRLPAFLERQGKKRERGYHKLFRTAVAQFGILDLGFCI